LEDYKK
jgi:isopropylmalate/homocitrate/citramalate synthase